MFDSLQGHKDSPSLLLKTAPKPIKTGHKITVKITEIMLKTLTCEAHMLDIWKTSIIDGGHVAHGYSGHLHMCQPIKLVIYCTIV